MATLKSISKAFQGSRGPVRDFYSYIGGGRTLVTLLATGTVAAIVVIGSSYEQPATPEGGQSDSNTGVDNSGEVIEPPDQEAAVGTSRRVINVEEEEIVTAPSVVASAKPEDLVLVDDTNRVIDTDELIEDAQGAAGGELPDSLADTLSF